MSNAETRKMFQVMNTKADYEMVATQERDMTEWFRAFPRHAVGSRKVGRIGARGVRRSVRIWESTPGGR